MPRKPIHKEKILELRSQGYTYDQIQNELGCSKSTISFHCGEGQKEKLRLRSEKRRKGNPVNKKLEAFKHRVYNQKETTEPNPSYPRKGLANKASHFQIGKRETKLSEVINSFSYHDVVAREGESPTCYLTGEVIDWLEPATYNFDHIIPVSRGGDNSLENLGVALKNANYAKGDMLLEEFLELCEKVLRHHGRI